MKIPAAKLLFPVLSFFFVLIIWHSGIFCIHATGTTQTIKIDDSANWAKIWKRKGNVALEDHEDLHKASGFNQLSLQQWRALVSTAMNADHLSLSRFHEGDHIVDFGCGAGAFLQALGEAVKNVRVPALVGGPSDLQLYGIDFSPSLVNVAKKRVGHDEPGHFFNGDVTDVSFLANEEFDHSVSWSVLFYLNDLNDALRAVSEMVRVTKVGGSIIIAEVSDAGREAEAKSLRGASDYYQNKQKKNINGSAPRHLYYPKSFFRENLPKMGVRVDVIIDERDMTPPLDFYEPSQYRYTVFATKLK